MSPALPPSARSTPGRVPGSVNHMSHASPGGRDAQVQHQFDGDVNILNATFDSRMEIRKALAKLHQVLQKSEAQSVQVMADMKLRIAGHDAKEHTYSVAIGNNFDQAAFQRQASARRARETAANADSGTTAVINGQRPGSATTIDDDVNEQRPPKRARHDPTDDGAVDASRETDALLREALSILKQRSSSETLDFIKQWHTEWVKQGGWLFDTLNKIDKAAKDNFNGLQTRISMSQDVLGQSMNAASASTMAELQNISKLIPWVEHCRKTAADKTQAREEKWRTSSATFHDQSRRDREAAEKKIDDELRRQSALLVKIAEANGVDVDDEDDGDTDLGRDEHREEREESLGAQLTAELNMEANRAEKERQAMDRGAINSSRTREEPIPIEDDERDEGK
ncbi:hypothetical protein Tdes44962_MAKER07316 [Teratosphaeria destructans]|uniref:Uncharacterized protein n=1 Tax=Teratosphaeria destructans TaxID=418781 RepID=A0A9W7SZQ7_9PEZI|nr:hypothetical protein Tdes44962_MAKER07316 [Teratosphaeria destructans]